VRQEVPGHEDVQCRPVQLNAGTSRVFASLQ
jgi:hypothetical protein